MDNEQVNKKWYAPRTDSHQGIVVCEDTGENIAVTYKKENARLVAAAPELLEAIREIIEWSHLNVCCKSQPEAKEILNRAFQARNKAIFG